MGKTVWFLLGMAAVSSVAFSYRRELEPLVSRVVPHSVLEQIDRLPAAYLPSQLTAVLGLDKREFQSAESAGKSAESAGKTGGEPSGNPSQKGTPESGRQAQAAPGGGAAKGGTPPAPVNAAIAQLAEMPVVLSAPGTVEAMATVAIKPRVDGQVIEVGFKEGDLVTEGSMLYRLDDRLAKAQIKQAEAAVTRDRASLKDAEQILDRKETLLRNKYASEAQTDTARQSVEVLKANIAAGLATVDAQKTQLDYLTIRAPITGRTGSINGKLGTFVRSADLLPLLTINQTKPIAVSFALPQVNLDAMRTALNTKSTAVITVPGIKPFKVTGVLNFVDNQVDKTTGTVTGKVMVENTNEELWPGQAVGVDLTVEVLQNIIALPASAIQPAQQGMIAWVIAADNTVSIRTVKQERVIGQIAYVTDGLKSGDKVVTDGQLRLGPGGRVSIRETVSVPLSALKVDASSLPGAPTGVTSGGVNGRGDQPDVAPPLMKLPAADAVTSEPRKNKRG